MDLRRVELHIHTERGSLKDAAMNIPQLIDRAKECGYDTLAVTEHGKMYSAYEFYNDCTFKDPDHPENDANIKPIFGIEIYVQPEELLQKKHYYHMIILAKNLEGYRQLCRSTRVSEKNKYRGKPRLTDEDLKKFFSGGDIIALSGCIGGEIQQLLLNNMYDKAKKRALFYKRLFGYGNFYIELQYHKTPDQKKILPLQIKLARELHIPIVITNDSHFARRTDKSKHDIVIAMQRGKTLQQMREGNNNVYTEEHYLKSPQELYDTFIEVIDKKIILEGFENSIKIAEKCNVVLPTGEQHYPKYPKLDKNHTAEEVLKEWAYKELPYRVNYLSLSPKKQKEITDRIDFELDVIDKSGYAHYFLIVADILEYLRSIGGYAGLGRGSGVASLVAYSIGITNLNPLPYNLNFDRFLNLERVSAPDFDLDMDELRDEVKAYTVKTYGEEKVCGIITFGTMAARGSVRDVGRVMGEEYGINLALCDRIAKMIPSVVGVTIKSALGIDVDKNGKPFEEFYSHELVEEYNSNPTVKLLLDNAMSVEGMVRHVSTHAAAVIIADRDVSDYIPVEWDDENEVWRSQFYKDYCEAMGLLKMDYLGLNTLTVIKNTAKLVNEKYGLNLTHDKIIELALKDPDVIKQIYATGETGEVFQFESIGMIDVLKAFNPETIEDLILLNSVYRPGPKQYIPRLIENKKDPSKIQYDHLCLKPILDQTYGIVVYQEQVMAIFRALCDYSYGKADIIRRAMSKKKLKKLVAARGDFINGCINKGISEKRANDFFDELIDFASYAFNKSHAAAYAVTSLETAYLKLRYPVEYMTSALTYVPNSDALPVVLNETKHMGIKILVPDINRSKESFMPEDDGIRFGLSGIKNVGKAAVEIISGQPYSNLADFLERQSIFLNTNKSALESLIAAGCFESLGYNRKTLIENIDIFKKFKSAKKKQTPGQIDFFSMGAIDSQSTIQIKSYPEYDFQLKLEKEKEVLSCYASGHPLDQYKYFCDKYSELNFSDISPEVDGNEVIIISRIEDIKKLNRKSDGKPMARLKLEDFTGSIDCMVFTKQFEQFGKFLVVGNILKMKVKISAYEEDNKLIKQLYAREISTIEVQDKVWVKVPSRDKIFNFNEIAEKNSGPYAIFVYVESEHKGYRYMNYLVDLNDNIINYFGKENVAV